jgi:hypothetical protein
MSPLEDVVSSIIWASGMSARANELTGELGEFDVYIENANAAGPSSVTQPSTFVRGSMSADVASIHSTDQPLSGLALSTLLLPSNPSNRNEAVAAAGREHTWPMSLSSSSVITSWVAGMAAVAGTTTAVAVQPEKPDDNVGTRVHAGTLLYSSSLFSRA